MSSRVFICFSLLHFRFSGAIISGKRYDLSDYLSAAVITGGCMVFIMTGVRALSASSFLLMIVRSDDPREGYSVWRR